MTTIYKITILFSTLLFLHFSGFSQFNDDSSKKLERAIKVITSQYVDSLDDVKLVESAIKAMVGELDPHSKYMSVEDTKKSNESIVGSFGGVGIHYQIINDTLTVLKVTKNGPSEKAGIKPGDKLLEINGEIAIGKAISNTYFSSKLRGENGTKITLKIKQRSSKEIKTIEIERGAIAIYTIDAAFMLDNENGYIRVNGFSNTTISEFQFAALQLQFQGMKNLIVDLRGNPGGLMKASIDMSALFLEDKKLIVYTEGLHYKKENYESPSVGAYNKGRLVVMMDENSASASEIFAGAMQDWDRGMIIGRRSYGKGLVGRTFTLTDGSSIRLTTGRYYTPSGRSIQKPYIKGEKSEYDKDLKRRFEHGELYHADSISLPDSLKFRTANGRLVYGGGAIMPDYFTAIDTISGSETFLKLNSNGALNLFVGKYFDQNLEELNSKYPNYRIFKKTFEMDKKTISDFRQFAIDDYMITFSDSTFKADEKYIKSYFKAILARDLFEGSSFFEEIIMFDENLVKSHEIIKNRKLFKEMKIQEE